MKALILSCSTGEGHNSAAKAVLMALEERGIECTLIDPISLKSKKASHIAAEAYNGIIRRVPFLFGIIYKLGQAYNALNLPSPVRWANKKYTKELKEYILENKFDFVVCSHIYPMYAMCHIKQELGLNIPTYTVLTDYTAIPFYKDIGALDFHFVSCEETKRFLSKKGKDFTEDKIYISGIPVNYKFEEKISQKEAREKLNIPEDKKIITLLSGGAGCGKISKLSKKFDKSLDENHLILVFVGKNQKLKEKLSKKFSDNKKFRLVDFTTDVYLYVKASDVVLSKPGGLSSTEIAAANVPLVHLKAIPGCESYNVKHFVSRGISVYGKSVRSAVRHTLTLLENEDKREEMLKNQRENIPQNSAKTIAKMIEDFQ